MVVIKYCCFVFEMLQEQIEVTWNSSISLPGKEQIVSEAEVLLHILIICPWVSVEPILHQSGTSK